MSDLFDDRCNCHRRLFTALRTEMEDRDRHPDDWEDRERYAITVAANQWAVAHGLHPVTEADVEAIEHLAMGHVDYATKLALYVTELVYR